MSNLKKLLEGKEKNKYLYCQCKNDYDKINEMYQMWWENIIEKYQLGTCVEERLKMCIRDRLGIVNIKKREESIRSMIEQCCGIIVITGALLCAVLFKYQL